MNRGDEAVALARWTTPSRITAALPRWSPTTTVRILDRRRARLERTHRGRPSTVREGVRMNPSWMLLVPRLPGVGQLPKQRVSSRAASPSDRKPIPPRSDQENRRGLGRRGRRSARRGAARRDRPRDGTPPFAPRPRRGATPLGTRRRALRQAGRPARARGARGRRLARAGLHPRRRPLISDGIAPARGGRAAPRDLRRSGRPDGSRGPYSGLRRLGTTRLGRG